MKNLTVLELVKKFNLNQINSIDLSQKEILVPEINRPAFLLTGYERDFICKRVQLLGNIEIGYLKCQNKETRKKAWERLFSYNVPCVIITDGIVIEEEVVRLASKMNTPILTSTMSTSKLIGEITKWLNVKLAPRKAMHGVLVDIYGEGVLITGDSGIGKSEATMELIRRGHRLVSDDLVEILKVSDDTLVGRSPKATKYMLELRGIGIIDIRKLFGVNCTKESKAITMIVSLENWESSNAYDRIGLNESFTEILGNRIRTYKIPVKPGRNIAIILEAAAVNHRQVQTEGAAYKIIEKRLKENREDNY